MALPNPIRLHESHVFIQVSFYLKETKSATTISSLVLSILMLSGPHRNRDGRQPWISNYINRTTSTYQTLKLVAYILTPSVDFAPDGGTITRLFVIPP